MMWLGKYRALWVSILIGITVILLYTANAPFTSHALSLVTNETEKLIAKSEVLGVSGDGQFVAVFEKLQDQLTLDTIQGRIVVKNWECNESDWIGLDVSSKVELATVVFSNDESKIVFILELSREKELIVFDLRTRRQELRRCLDADSILFSENGTLVYIKDGIVRDTEADKVFCQVKQELEGANYLTSVGKYLIYRRGQRLYVHSAWNEVKSTHFQVPQNYVVVPNQIHITSSGNVLLARGFWNKEHRQNGNYGYIWIEAFTGYYKDLDSSRQGSLVTHSPDGKHLVWLEHGAGFSFPLMSPRKTTFLVTGESSSNKEIARISNATGGCFSANGKKIATCRNERYVDVYDFPFRTSWTHPILLGLVGFTVPLCSFICMSYVRRRNRAMQSGDNGNITSPTTL